MRAIGNVHPNRAMSPPATESPKKSPRGIVGALALAAGFAGGYLGIGAASVPEPRPEPPKEVAPKPSASPSAARSAEPEEAPKAPPVERAGFIDRKGQWAIAAQFTKARPFSEGLARVAVGDRWGFVDEQGKTVVP